MQVKQITNAYYVDGFCRGVHCAGLCSRGGSARAASAPGPCAQSARLDSARLRLAARQPRAVAAWHKAWRMSGVQADAGAAPPPPSWRLGLKFDEKQLKFKGFCYIRTGLLSSSLLLLADSISRGYCLGLSELLPGRTIHLSQARPRVCQSPPSCSEQDAARIQSVFVHPQSV